MPVVDFTRFYQLGASLSSSRSKLVGTLVFESQTSCNLKCSYAQNGFLVIQIELKKLVSKL